MILKDESREQSVWQRWVIDSSYRTDFRTYNQTTKISIFITKKVSKTEKNVNCIKYPYSKAICQF